MKQLFYNKNTIKLFERKNNTRHVTGQELPPFGKFVTEVLIFAAANTVFQLNLIFIADSRTGFCAGLL